MRARQFVLRTHYSMYRRCPQRWRIATVATDTPPNLLPVQGLYSNDGRTALGKRYRWHRCNAGLLFQRYVKNLLLPTVHVFSLLVPCSVVRVSPSLPTLSLSLSRSLPVFLPPS